MGDPKTIVKQPKGNQSKQKWIKENIVMSQAIALIELLIKVSEKSHRPIILQPKS